MKPTVPVYVLSGVADFRPPKLWEEAASRDLLEKYWETGKLDTLYGESLLWTGFERLLAEAASNQIDLSRTRTINIGVSYPRELAQMTEDEIVEDFYRRLRNSPQRKLFNKLPEIRFTPTHAASSSGMVPFNDAVADILIRGEETSIVVTSGNSKGTNRNRPRIGTDKTNEIFSSLISPFDRKYTGANMLKLGAVALGEASQDYDRHLLEALGRLAYDQRLFTHQLATQNLSTAHVTTHPDKIKDQTVFYPVKLLSIAPQSLGYAGLVLSRKAPNRDRAVRVVGLGSGVDATSIRDRKSHLFSRAMESSVIKALRQAKIADSSDLKILELHNPFPGVSLTELGIMLEFIGYQGSLSYSILHGDIGVNGKLIEIGRSGGAMSGHAITPTFIRLVFEASKGLLGTGGYSRPKIAANRVAYAGVSGVGGHHTFDGYLFLAGGKTENVANVASDLAPFDHDSLNRIVERDLRRQANLTAADIPDNMTVAFISFRESRLGREYFGIARAPDGRDFPFSASQPLFERLDGSRSDGHPIRLSSTLHAIEDWRQIKLQPESFMPATV
jgi:hypothetical protein